MGHPFTRLIECLLSASSDLFYSPFLPLRSPSLICFFFMPHPSSSSLCSISKLSSFWLSDSTAICHLCIFLQLTLTLDIMAITWCFLDASDWLWGDIVTAWCNSASTQYPEPGNRDFCPFPIIVFFLLPPFFVSVSYFFFVLHCPLCAVFVPLWLSACLLVLTPLLCSLMLSSRLTSLLQVLVSLHTKAWIFIWHTHSRLPLPIVP